MGRIKDITQNAHDRYMQERGNQQLVQRCGFCDWTIQGTLVETLAAAKQHRLQEHPQARQRTRLVRNRAGIRTIGTRTLEENVAATRLQGGSGWLTDQ